LTPQPKKKKAKKLTVTKVQDAVNKAIKERESVCINQDATCKGNLEASHFFGKGGNGGLRYYPPNIHPQCSKHHFDHHQRNPLCYVEWIEENLPDQVEWMKTARVKVLKYSQPVLKDIYEMAKSGKLDELTQYIETLLG
jgi:hypothetical protein